MPTILKGETIPISTDMEISQQPVLSEQTPVVSNNHVPEPIMNEPPPIHNIPPPHHGRFFDSLKKKMREAAGIDAPFINPYLGQGHPSTMMPPYGKQTTESPEYHPNTTTTTQPITAAANNDPTSSFIPPSVYPHMIPSSSLWNHNYYPQSYPSMMMYPGMMYNPMMMSMMMNGYYGQNGYPNNYYNALTQNPYGTNYGNPVDLIYSSHSNMFNNPYSYGAYPSLGGYPYYVSALPVQDKRLLPERNLISSVKDIWQTNLR